MSKEMWKKMSKKSMLLIVLCFVAIAYVWSKTEVRASEKTQLAQDEIIIGIGSDSNERMFMYDMKENARYTYKSSDTKIVKVDKNGLLTGVKIGAAQITVKQVLNGKTTKIGTCKVTVVEASIEKEMTSKYYSKKELSNLDYNLNRQIFYRNSDAKYEFVSSDPSIVKINSKGQITYMEMKETSVKITVKETYKKKTKKIGTVQFHITLPKLLKSECEVALHHTLGDYEIIDSGSYCIISEDSKAPTSFEHINDASSTDYDQSNDILRFRLYDELEHGVYDYWFGEFYANKEGTAYIHIYASSDEPESYIGSVKVDVIYQKTKTLKWGDIERYTDEETKKIRCRFASDSKKFYIPFECSPVTTSDLLEIKSSDPEIASIKQEYLNYSNISIPNYTGFYIEVHKEGTATFTVTLGEKTISLTMEFIDTGR